MDWCRVVKRSVITKDGLPLLTLNYGYPDGVDIFRDSIAGQSNSMVTYNTYPSVDLIRKYGITVFIHSEFRGIAPDLLASGLKGGSDDMAGDFEVVDCRSLTQEGKEECRILSLDCSKEFLDYLATKTRNHKYPLFDHHVYINGGKGWTPKPTLTPLSSVLKLPPY